MSKLFCYSLCLCCLAFKQANAFIYFLPDYRATEISGRGPNALTLEKSCPQLGYSKTSCPDGYFLSVQCPYFARYFKECKSNAEYCSEQGYVSSCPVGEVPDLSDVCPKDESYFKCKCNPCEGYNYTYEQATTEGYVVDGAGCQSCDAMKYKRKPAPCVGYNYDNTNCNVTSYGNLEGGSCRSGNVTKYEKCTPCPVTCPSGQENMDTYWCSGAWRCLLPAS